jgi:Concanavalin A-like lectin/glucanases superfamily
VTIDQGAWIGVPGNLTAPDVGALQFGTGDFTAAALIQTTGGGSVVSKKFASDGSPADAGWQVVVHQDGTITFATESGSGYDEIDSVATAAVDGQWHHVAAVRGGGQLGLYFDGQPLPATRRSNLPTPLNVSGSAQLTIGGPLGPQGQLLGLPAFYGVIEDVALFNRALAQPELPACMFNLLTGSEPGLVGLYRLNGDGRDDSPTRNDATPNNKVAYVPVYHCAWADGGNAFSYLSITSPGGAPPPGQPAPALDEPVTRTQSLSVAAGSPYLCAGVCDDSGLFAFPAGATVTLRDPSGAVYNQDTDEEALYIKTDGHGSPWVVVAAAPAAGAWTATITAPAGAGFSFSMVALPSGNLIDAIEQAMSPILPPAPAHISAELARAGPAAADDNGLWGYLGATALGAVGGAILAAAGAVTVPAAVIGLVVYNGALTVLLARQMLSDINAAAPTPPIAAFQAAQYMAQGYAGGPPPLDAVVAAVKKKVGEPSTTDPDRFASRADMGVDDSYHVHLDLGGEGYYEYNGKPHGFRDAINLNALTVNSQLHNVKIPTLVQVPSFATNPQYPFTDGIADYVTIQGAKLTARNVKEIARLLRVGGKAELWIRRATFQAQIDDLGELLGCTPTYSTDPESGCIDQFAASTEAFPKICLQKNQ